MAAGGLKIDIRRKAILEQLNRDGRVSVTDLSMRLATTPVTIRTDLDALASEGRLQRTRGGAVTLQQANNTEHTTVIPCAKEKKAIAQLLAERIMDGDTLFINSGTTTLAIAQALSQKKRLNVVTNSIDVAYCLAPMKTLRVVLLGGEINVDYGFTFGGNAVEQLRHYQADWCILSVDGVAPSEGVTTYHAEEVLVDRMMAARANRTVIAADHQKIGKIGFSRVDTINHRQIIATDDGVDAAVLEQLRTMGATVWVAAEEQ